MSTFKWVLTIIIFLVLTIGLLYEPIREQATGECNTTTLVTTKDGVNLYKYNACWGQTVYFSSRGTQWDTTKPIGRSVYTEHHNVPNAD